MENDRIMIEWLEFFDVPFVFILTKSDKISNNQYRETSTKLHENYPDCEILKFSSKNKTGREEILHILEMLNHN
jgi:GTP-binding protein